jgi:hypothetical protein
MTDLASQVTDNNCHVTRLFAVQWLSLRNDRRAHPGINSTSQVGPRTSEAGTGSACVKLTGTGLNRLIFTYF